MPDRGIAVRNGNAYIVPIKQCDTSLACAARVDKRVVRNTIEKISRNMELAALFSRLDSVAVLANAASLLGRSAIKIVPMDSHYPDIMAGINVRQTVVTTEPEESASHLIITVNGDIPCNVLTKVRGSLGILNVIIR